jgi:hypothetical protein
LAFQYLQAAIQIRDTGLAMLPIHHSFDGLRSDEQYKRAVERIGIRYPQARLPDLSTLKGQTDRG